MERKNWTQTRQGDLLIEKINKSDKPKNLTKVTSGVLAYGEVTGHAHRVNNLDKVDMFVDESGNIIMQPRSGCKNVEFDVSHDEHATIAYSATQDECYRVTRQREYDANAREEERKVAD